MRRVFWKLVYFVYSLGGVAVRKRRSRILEIACLLVGGLQVVAWIYALVVNYSANANGAPIGLAFGALLILVGLFFRHVRLRSAEDPHYLSEMGRAH